MSHRLTLINRAQSFIAEQRGTLPTDKITILYSHPPEARSWNEIPTHPSSPLHKQSTKTKGYLSAAINRTPHYLFPTPLPESLTTP